MKEQHLFNDTKIILDLCGGTGAWSRPYKEAGYDVRLVTFPEQDIIDYIPPKNVYGILAAPPCTMFSRARNRYDKTMPRDFITGMIPVNACIRIAWTAHPVFFAMENPMGLLSRWLGKAQYYFDPWWFGDPYTKKTALWGWFNKPKRQFYRKIEIMTQEQIDKCKLHGQKLPSSADFTGGTQAELRAITPPGFSQAFFEANQ